MLLMQNFLTGFLPLQHQANCRILWDQLPWRNVFYLGMLLVKLEPFSFAVAQDITEEEMRMECEKKQTQTLQYVFRSMLFVLSYSNILSITGGRAAL